MRNLIFFLSLFFILAVLPVLAVEPPSLENHQFYGYVFWNESQTAPKTVTATLSIASFPSAIKDTACVNKACSGKYGYSSDNILRVKGGKQGDLILFKVDSFLLKNYTYEPDQATQLNFSLFAGAVAPAINLSASVNLTACSSNWNCSDWNTCTEQKQSRTCNDLNKCNSSLINKTEEQSCGTAANNVPSQKKTTPKNVTAALGCPYYWDCSTWSECSTVGTQTRTCLRTDDCDQKLKDKKVEEILKDLSQIPEKVKTAVVNHGGGYYNHSFFWQILKKDVPFSGKVSEAIVKQWGSFDKFKEELSNAAVGKFGSGWAWLVLNKGRLEIITTSNQDCPLSLGMVPLLNIDVWEHAYYLKYQNRRAEYVENFFKVINWKKVDELYNKAVKK